MKKLMRAAVVFLLVFLLGGCADVPGRCGLGLAHEDCAPYGYAHPFPADDTICRSYGLRRGTADYAHCRTVKDAAQQRTRDTINAEWLRNPFL